MKYFFRNILQLLPLFLFLVISFSSCENDITLVNSITTDNEKQKPIEEEKNVEIIYSDSAQARAKLTAPVLNRFAGKKSFMELPKGMNVIFYDDNKNEQTKLTADYGIGFDNGNGMERMEAVPMRKKQTVNPKNACTMNCVSRWPDLGHHPDCPTRHRKAATYMARLCLVGRSMFIGKK